MAGTSTQKESCDRAGGDLASPSSVIPPLPPDDFLASFRDRAIEHIRNAYVAECRTLHTSATSGILTFNLSEDLIYVAKVQGAALDDYLSALTQNQMAPTDAECMDKDATPRRSGPRSLSHEDLRAEAVFSLLHSFYCQQLHKRDMFLTDLEACCAAANDYHRLMEQTEAWAEEVNEQHPELGLLESSELSSLLILYATDAAYSARMAHLFVYESIHESTIPVDLFSQNWEEMTENQVALSVVRTLQDYLSDIEVYLCDDHLLQKTIESLVQATVVFNVECLIQRSQQTAKEKSKIIGKIPRENSQVKKYIPFLNPMRAVQRFKDDIFVMRNFFKIWVLEIPALDCVIERELAVLDAICVCFGIAVGTVDLDCTGSVSCIAVLQRLTDTDSDVMTKFVKDLWRLADGDGGSSVILPDCIEKELTRIQTEAIEVKGTRAHTASARTHISALSVHDVLLETYAQEKPQMNRAVHATQRHHLSRRKVVAGVKADLRSARRTMSKQLRKVPLSKASAKKSASSFIRTCKATRR